MKKFRRVGLTVKSGFPQKNKVLERIIAILRGEQVVVLMDAKRTADLPCSHGCETFQDGHEIDLLLVVGGDGTILRSVRELTDLSVPILSINRGTVGFLAEIELKDAEADLPPLLRGEGVIDERSMLSVLIERGGETVFSGFALNEAVIAQGTIARIVDLKTSVNGEPLTTFHSDGLILATPTGSTAYSLSAGGPIVHPAFPAAIILTPINPHSFSQKPVVIRGDSTIDVEVALRLTKFADTDVNLTLDGQVYVPLIRGDHVRATMAPHPVKFIRKKQDTFLKTLRTKLKWGEAVN